MKAAGHGNLYNESYTAYMERLVQPVFRSVGINFLARNYAMGDEPSVPELSSCFDEIYGTDNDFVSWDFGITDHQRPGNSFEFGYRAITSPGRPALLGIDTGRDHIKSFMALETLGLDGNKSKNQTVTTTNKKKSTWPVFVADPELERKMMEPYPDCINMTATECSSKYPKMVAGLKCGTFDIGRGEPCHSLKYSKEICPNRPEQVHWHRG